MNNIGDDSYWMTLVYNYLTKKNYDTIRKRPTWSGEEFDPTSLSKENYTREDSPLPSSNALVNATWIVSFSKSIRGLAANI